MQIVYDRAAVQQLMEDMGAVGENFRRAQDRATGIFRSCRERYTRLQGEVEQLLRRCQNDYYEAEGELRAAQAEYREAQREQEEQQENGQSSGGSGARLEQARRKMVQAQVELEKAEVALSGAQEKQQDLETLWSERGAPIQDAVARAEDRMHSYMVLVSNSSSDLGEYMDHMEQARTTLSEGGVTGGASSGGSGGSAYGSAAGGSMGPSAGGSGSASRGGSASVGAGSAAAASAGASDISGGASRIGSGSAGSAGGAAGTGSSGVGGQPFGSARGSTTGWCPQNRMSSVTCSEGGAKRFSMPFGDREKSYPCSKAGAASAYRDAIRSGDAERIVRASAIFEVETLRDDLELGGGDSSFVQMGGYHGDVRRQEPSGYESHHIPSRAVQDRDADLLPAIAITHEDHSQTSSYAGRQRKVYESFIPGGPPAQSYKEDVADKIGEGSSGYLEAMRDELYDLRIATGSRYDGGIGAFLDAVVDMIATRGIPGRS